VSLPGGFEVGVAYGVLALKAAGGQVVEAEPFMLRIDGPGRFEGAGFAVEVRAVRRPGVAAEGTVRVDPSAHVLPLWLRSRRPGDRFRPRGGSGEKKLKAFLIDRKIPRQARARLPLLCDDRGQVLWVVGVRASQAACDGEGACRAWQIRVEASVCPPRALLQGAGGLAPPGRRPK
jgi:tRNA(Ile)-lysidine synthase